jgi:hypothetical protein
MSYDEFARRKPREYTPRQLLHSDIRLMDGKVTCLSCHRLRIKAPVEMVKAGLDRGKSAGCMVSGELTAGPGREGLCRACHIK